MVRSGLKYWVDNLEIGERVDLIISLPKQVALWKVKLRKLSKYSVDQIMKTRQTHLSWLNNKLTKKKIDLITSWLKIKLSK